MFISKGLRVVFGSDTHDSPMAPSNGSSHVKLIARIGPGLPAGWTSIEPNAVDATLFHAQYPRMMQEVPFSLCWSFDDSIRIHYCR